MGKSTTLRSVMGLVTPTSGRVMLAGSISPAGSRMVYGASPEKFRAEEAEIRSRYLTV